MTDITPGCRERKTEDVIFAEKWKNQGTVKPKKIPTIS